MTSPEDFTSDDVLNAGFTSPSLGLRAVQPSLEESEAAELEKEEVQDQPIEIPRGTDDNSECSLGGELNPQYLTSTDFRCRGQEAVCRRSQLGDQGTAA